jgi:hypothetical protein
MPSFGHSIIKKPFADKQKTKKFLLLTVLSLRVSPAEFSTVFGGCCAILRSVPPTLAIGFLLYCNSNKNFPFCQRFERAKRREERKKEGAGKSGKVARKALVSADAF